MTTTGDTAPLAVGFIGLGDQGGPMARAVAEAGHDLHTWARRRASLAALDGVPYTVHDSPADLGADCDVVCLCLPEDADTDGLVHGAGLFSAMRSGAVLANQGTGVPAFAEKLALDGAGHGIPVLDAPVSGARAGALAKTLATYVGGDAAAAETCRPVFESFSRAVVHVGGPGAGQLTKLLNNALMMMNQRNLEEILPLAARFGIVIPALVEALAAGSASSVALEAMNTAITAENAAHLQKLELLDMELFSTAVHDRGLEAEGVVTRAVAGAQGLVDLEKLTRPTA